MVNLENPPLDSVLKNCAINLDQFINYLYNEEYQNAPYGLILKCVFNAKPGREEQALGIESRFASIFFNSYSVYWNNEIYYLDDTSEFIGESYSNQELVIFIAIPPDIEWFLDVTINKKSICPSITDDDGSVLDLNYIRLSYSQEIQNTSKVSAWLYI